MNNLFVNFQTAKKLQQLGFKQKCFAVIDQTEFLHVKGEKGRGISGAMVYDEIPCPLYQQAIDWLYTNHKILIEYRPSRLKALLDSEIIQALNNIET